MCDPIVGIHMWGYGFREPQQGLMALKTFANTEEMLWVRVRWRCEGWAPAM